MMMCQLRWALKLMAALCIVMFLTVTNWQLRWAISEFDLDPQMMVKDFLHAAGMITATRWVLILGHIVLDLVEAYVTEKRRWDHVIGGRLRALPLFNDLCWHELGLHEFRWWKICRWYLLGTPATMIVQILIVVKYGVEPEPHGPTRVIPRQITGDRRLESSVDSVVSSGVLPALPTKIFPSM
jgi:hypothetical protein